MPGYVHKFECTFQNGKPILDSPGAFLNECRAFEGKRGFISAGLVKKQKSGNQNRYYRGVVVQRFAEYWGTSNEEAHRALSFEHLKIIPPNVKMPIYIRSTELSEWNTTEWEEYMAFLRRWGAEQFGLNIEQPNEVDYEQIKNVW